MHGKAPKAKNGKGRSRKGAWIEISVTAVYNATGSGRSRKGAWIEIAV